jgi:hypothetical protein
MKTLITIGLISVVLASSYSFVYACDHSTKITSKTKATRQVVTTNAKTIRTLVVGATTGCPASESVVSFDIDVPGRTTPRFIHIEAKEAKHIGAREPSTLRTAMTLGRAIATAFGAVVGELLDAATGKTASFV